MAVPTVAMKSEPASRTAIRTLPSMLANSSKEASIAKRMRGVTLLWITLRRSPTPKKGTRSDGKQDIARRAQLVNKALTVRHVLSRTGGRGTCRLPESREPWLGRTPVAWVSGVAGLSQETIDLS